MKSYHEFLTLQAARDHRHATGCGGWIFEDEATGQATIFPAAMTPISIMRHPLTLGKTGNLIGHG